jgi:phage terminase small subunit
MTQGVQKSGRRRSTPKTTAVVALPAADEAWGPAMKALNEKQRRFVLALYQVKPGHGAQVKAARLAGYGTPNSSAASWAALASRLIHDERVQAAFREHDQKVLRAATPRALLALHGMVEDPGHKDHARAVGMVLDRVHPVETVHHVRSEQRHVIVATDEVLARIRNIASAVGLDPDAMPPIIEADYQDITDDANGESDGSS